MKNPLLEKWEDKLQDIFDRIDHVLEERYGELYPLRPNRPAHGKGVTPDADGLFDLGVSFSAGIGSQFGPGYVFRVKLATLARVPENLVEKVENEVIDLLDAELPKEFPGKDLRVARDGHVYKIFGDLDLN
ncbi:MAG: hypothetical protein PHD82_03755 [Candidatus Riflebacteria bacterium]|nr:hypothetical protein [Candidatus Riflebacteria bacterium]